MSMLEVGARFIAAAAVCLAATADVAQTQVYLPDDPLWEDPDRLDVPMPKPQEIGDFYDFWQSTLGTPAEYEGPALNVNTLGEVPNSSWYENRHYTNPMSVEELATGPNTGNGPSQDGVWTVVAGKTEGETPGMQIQDADGDRYLLKFDPPGRIEIASGAEAVSTKLLYALGYHVPENYVVRFERSRLVPGAEGVFETPSGEEIPINDAVIDEMLAGAAHYDDGTYRALASKFLEGEPLGPFFYFGTRPDDGNDIFPHEGRRELRGLRIVAAWINHTDARSANTLDTFVESDGRRFVRHHLIDFGSTLGAAASGAKMRWDGYEYILDGKAMLLRAVTLGAAALEWAAIEYPNHDALGRFDARHFDPDDWRPQYPNPAFVRADEADAFWAAKQIARIGDDALRAIVSAATYSDPEVERTIADILIARRDSIGRRYLNFGGGLDRFRVRDGRLLFEDVQARFGHAEFGRVRQAVWRPFDNRTGDTGSVLASVEIGETELDIPAAEGEAFLSGEIRTPSLGITTVIVRRAADGWEVVGVERR